MKKGFTLVELLIVIGILGELAVGLFLALDPLEQTKKAADAAKKSISTQIVRGVNAYYASYGSFPGVGGWLNTAALPNAIPTMIAAGELNANFLNTAGQYMTSNVMYMYRPATGVSVCFNPQSKAARAEPNSRNNIYGGLAGTDCSAAVGYNDPAGCAYWCAR